MDHYQIIIFWTEYYQIIKLQSSSKLFIIMRGMEMIYVIVPLGGQTNLHHLWLTVF